MPPQPKEETGSIQINSIATNKPSKCPVINAKVEGATAKILLDSGSQISAMSEKWYEERKEILKKCPRLPVPGLSIKGAIGGRTKKIRYQILCKMKLNEMEIDAIFLVIGGLSIDLILGVDWLRHNKANINFGKQTLELQQGKREVKFEEAIITDQEKEEDIRSLNAMELEINEIEEIVEEETEQNLKPKPKTFEEQIIMGDELQPNEKGKLMELLKEY